MTLYERIVTGKGRHYQFADAAGSSMVAQGDRKEFTLHSSLPPDTDFVPIIRDLIGFPCDFEIRHVIPWRHHLLVAERYRDRPRVSRRRCRSIWLFRPAASA